MVEAGRWLLIASGLAGIVALYHHFPRANNTTVALTLLLLVLVFAGNWGLRYAVVASLAATVLFNYFFLPPVGTFTIADTQNWVALFAFLGTAMYASHLANRIREESPRPTHAAASPRCSTASAVNCSSPKTSPSCSTSSPPAWPTPSTPPPSPSIWPTATASISPTPSASPARRSPGTRTIRRYTRLERTRAEIVRDLREAMLHPVTNSARRRFPHRHPAPHRRPPQRRPPAGGHLPLARDHGGPQRPGLHVHRTRRGARRQRPLQGRKGDRAPAHRPARLRHPRAAHSAHLHQGLRHLAALPAGPHLRRARTCSPSSTRSPTASTTSSSRPSRWPSSTRTKSSST